MQNFFTLDWGSYFKIIIFPFLPPKSAYSKVTSPHTSHPGKEHRILGSQAAEGVGEKQVWGHNIDQYGGNQHIESSMAHLWISAHDCRYREPIQDHWDKWFAQDHSPSWQLYFEYHMVETQTLQYVRTHHHLFWWPTLYRGRQLRSACCARMAPIRSLRNKDGHTESKINLMMLTKDVF